MAVIGGVTYIGLLILGVMIAFVFALFAGLAGFLPHLRPIIGAVRMVLVAGGDSLNLAMWVIGIYAVVQFTESYMLTPLIQARAVFLPPAVVILNVGALFGAGPLQPRSPPLPSCHFAACSGRKRTRRVKPTRSALLADPRHAG